MNPTAAQDLLTKLEAAIADAEHPDASAALAGVTAAWIAAHSPNKRTQKKLLARQMAYTEAMIEACNQARAEHPEWDAS